MTKQKKKKSNKLIYGLVGLIALLLVGAIWKGQQKPKGLEVEVAKVERRTIKETVAASGKVFPEVEVKISPDVSGEIVELYIEEGDSVKLGQLLAKIDPDAIRSQVERGEAAVNNSKAMVAGSLADIERNKAGLVQAKAQLEATEVQLSNQKSVHERNIGLSKEGVISEQDFETSLSNLQQLEANFRSLKASLESAKANLNAAEQSAKAASFSVKSNEATLKELRTNLKRTSLFAPMNGVVSLLSVEKGERVVGSNMMAGTEMMRVANMSAMEVQVDVSESDIPKVALGNTVDVEVDAYLDRKFQGRVTEIANSATSATGAAVSLNSDQVTNFIVKISLDPSSYTDLISANNRYPFRPGMSASVEINTTTAADVWSVPIQAVTTREAEKEGSSSSDEELIKEVIFATVDGADSVKMIEVKTGIQDDTYIQVTAGLEGSEEIVVGPYSAVSKKLESGKDITKKKDKDKKELAKAE
ncbi:MAG: HlyD family secretion protein [Saprospiraceae bacterium]